LKTIIIFCKTGAGERPCELDTVVSCCAQGCSSFDNQYIITYSIDFVSYKANGINQQTAIRIDTPGYGINQQTAIRIDTPGYGINQQTAIRIDTPGYGINQQTAIRIDTPGYGINQQSAVRIDTPVFFSFKEIIYVNQFPLQKSRFLSFSSCEMYIALKPIVHVYIYT
jgi:hypothetical protein